MLDKKIDLNELPEHFGDNDAELFTDVADSFGEAEVTGSQLDRILSSTMRKAGYEMNEPIYEQGLIKISKTNSAKEDENAVKSVIAAKPEETDEHIESSPVKRWGGLAACAAFITVAAVSMAMLFGGGFIGKSEPEDVPAVTVSEPEPEPEADVTVSGVEISGNGIKSELNGGQSTIIVPDGAEVIAGDTTVSVDEEEMRKLGMVEMPNVFYMSSEAAEASIKRKGLVPRKVETVNLPLIDEDTVFYTDPSSGQYVKVGSVVTYYVCDVRTSRLEELRMLTNTFNKKYKDELELFKEKTGVIFEQPAYTADMTYEDLTYVSDKYKYLIALDEAFEEYLYTTYYESLVTVEIPLPESVAGTDARVYLYKNGSPYLSADIAKDSGIKEVPFELRGDGLENLEVYISDFGNFDAEGKTPYMYVDVNFITKTYTVESPAAE